MNKNPKLAIIGAGIAGVSAALYAKRAGLEFSLFEAKVVGGQLLYVNEVDNYAGLASGSKGSDLAKQLNDTLKELKIDIINQPVERVQIEDGIKIHCSDSAYSFDGLIIASGASFKSLGLKEESSLMGRGISYCAVCDGFFFRNQDVAVVGGGNSALEEALYLSGICRKVYLIHRRDSLRGLDYLQQTVFSRDNIEVIFDSVVAQISGADSLEGLKLESTKTKERSSLAVKALFIAIGVKPNTEIFKDIIKQDPAGFIITDEEMNSSHKAIWACGDCRKRPLRQLITAAGEGAVASLSAYKYLKGHYISS